MCKIEVMLADDHALVRQGLRRILEAEDDIAVIGEVNTGAHLLEAIEEGARPNVVLMDVQMPGMSGIETTRHLLQLLPEANVIGLTAVDEDETIAQMLQAGACGYVVKSAVASELISAIRRAHTTRSALKPHFRQRAERYWQVSYQQQLRPVKMRGEELTRREKDVMQILSKGYSNKEIARRLFISERTVQTHLSNIFQKMNVNSRTEAVLVAMRNGWLVPN
jgi:DNA-binding NarL/FixJ family response regulator